MLSHFSTTQNNTKCLKQHFQRLQMGGGTIEEENIILNPRFDDGLSHWSGRGQGNPFIVEKFVKILPVSGQYFSYTTNRTETWHGIQQEITGRVQEKVDYEVAAVVSPVCNNSEMTALVQITLWVQKWDGQELYTCITNLQASTKAWTVMQGQFKLDSVPARAIIFIEGPPGGVAILMDSLIVKPARVQPPKPPTVIENVSFGDDNMNQNDAANDLRPLFECALRIGTGPDFSYKLLSPVTNFSVGPFSVHVGFGESNTVQGITFSLNTNERQDDGNGDN